MLINCSECGKQISDNAVSCPNCGNPIGKEPAREVKSFAQRQAEYLRKMEMSRPRQDEKSEKSRVAFILLALLLGWLGVHNFYIGRIGPGVWQLLLTVLGIITSIVAIGYVLLFILFVWVIVDICSVTRDAKGMLLS